ncbi:hypothetical protein [Paraburkholderia sp. RAU6.4a]|uniref:hypothetical protein n=1 Tax=Paraburkholderia sp. RAU6.4a TaxID=2991067 RepID=UPI003D235227
MLLVLWHVIFTRFTHGYQSRSRTADIEATGTDSPVLSAESYQIDARFHLFGSGFNSHIKMNNSRNFCWLQGPRCLAYGDLLLKGAERFVGEF